MKYALDGALAAYGFGQPWSPLNYLIWPNDRVLRVVDLTAPDRAFSLTMLALSLPSIWVGGVRPTLHHIHGRVLTHFQTRAEARE